MDAEPRRDLPALLHLRASLAHDLVADLANDDCEPTRDALVRAALQRGYTAEAASEIAAWTLQQFKPAKGRRNGR